MKTAMGILAALLLLAVPAPHARLLTWHFQNTKFDDGGVLTGWFQWDADTSKIGTYSVEIKGGTDPVLGAGHDYTYRSGPDTDMFPDATGDGGFAVTTKGGTPLQFSYGPQFFLTDDGIDTNIRFGVETQIDRDGNLFQRTLVPGGYLTTKVSEPKSVALLGVGAGLLMLWRKRIDATARSI